MTEALVQTVASRAASGRTETHSLGRTTHVQLNASLVDGPTLVVTFAPRASSATSIWGLGPLKKIGVSALGFVDFADAYYPVREVEALAEALPSILARYDRIILYGHSMGGYGALKFGRLLRATRAVALAPAYSVTPTDIGAVDRRRPRAFYRPALHDGMAVTPADVAPDTVVTIDPLFENDRVHLDAVRAAGCRVAYAPAYFLNHGVLNGVLETGLAKPFVEEVAFGSGPAGVRQLLRRGRSGSPRYVAGALRRLQERRRPAFWRLMAETHARPLAGKRLVQAALDGQLHFEAEEPVPKGLRPGDEEWEAFFFAASPVLVAPLLAGTKIRSFLRWRHARRWVEVQSNAGAVEEIDAFLDILLKRRKTTRERRMFLARSILRNGKSQTHFRIAQRLVDSAGAIATDADRAFDCAVRLGATGRTYIPAQLFSSAYGRLVDGAWRTPLPGRKAEIARSLAIDLPPGQFEVTLDFDGAPRRWIDVDVAGRARSYAESPDRLKIWMRRLGLASGGGSTSFEIPESHDLRGPRPYVIVRARSSRGGEVAIRGASITRAAEEIGEQCA